MSARRRSALVGLFVMGSLAAPHLAATAVSEGFRAPTPVLRTLANGLTIAVFEDDRLPLVQIQLLVEAGSAQEPAGEAGIANLTFQMLGHGTASRTAVAYDDAVRTLGGSVGGGISREFATVNGAFLARDMEAGLELLVDAVVNPLFEEERLVATKNQIASVLADARQDPAALADDHLWSAVFRGHPYGRPPHGAPRALAALGVGHVRAFHRARYRPDHALLAIAGDVTPERALKAAEDLLGTWGGRATDVPAADLPPPDPGWRVRIVDVPGLTRVELRLGAVGPSRGGADHDPLSVAGELLAAGKEAGIRAGVSGLRNAGLFSIASSSPVDSAGREVARIHTLLATGLAEPPAGAALDEVKRRVTGAFALQFETRGGLIGQWMAAAFYAGAGDRLGGHEDRIRSLTADAVRAAFARHVRPDRMVLVALGPADRLRPQLEGLGAIEVIPAEAVSEVIEQPSTAWASPTPDQVARGRALVGQAAAAHGGLERLRGIKDSTLEGNVTVAPGPGERAGTFLQVRKHPDRFIFSLTVAVISSTQVLDGNSGWSRMGDDPASIEDLDSSSVAGLRAGNRSDPRHLLLAAADPASRVAWRGRERQDERDADVIELVPADGGRRLIYLDAESHRLVATEQAGGGHSERRIFRDLRTVNGVLWPFNETRMMNGQRVAVFSLTRAAFNTGVRDDLFLKPGSKPRAEPAKRPRTR